METGRGLREMSPDPPGGPAIGTRVHEVVRSSGRDYVADTVVTELDPGASYRFSGAGTIGGVAGGRAVRADEAGRAPSHLPVELRPTAACGCCARSSALVGG